MPIRIVLHHISDVSSLGVCGVVGYVAVYLLVHRHNSLSQLSRYRSCYWDHPIYLGVARLVSSKLLMELQAWNVLVSPRSPKTWSTCIDVACRGMYVSIS